MSNWSEVRPDIRKAVEACERARLHEMSSHPLGEGIVAARARLAALLVPLQRDAALGRFMRNRLEVSVVVEMGVSGPDHPWGLEVELANGEWHMLTELHPEPAPDSLDEALARLTGEGATDT